MDIKNLCRAPFVLLEDSRPAHRAGQSFLFHSPDHIITAEKPEDIAPALAAMDAAYAAGYHLAGWVAYEVAGIFEARLQQLLTENEEPFIWMMATKNRLPVAEHEITQIFHETAEPSAKIHTANQTEETYKKALSQILDYINAGDVYQVNYTFPLGVQAEGSARALYNRLRRTQPVPYGAYIETGDLTVLSLSPELFLKRRGNRLEAQPMKGTAPRGLTRADDRAIASTLATDQKSRAENLMIVDLIRNDLSRISEPGTVQVPELFATEQYPTLHQMTSTIEAEAIHDLAPSKLLAAMFPCGSVTGAPKIRAMEIIHELETGPRGIYCGAIGHFSPAGKGHQTAWTLNVPIRTLRQKGHTLRLDVGSGIVADSDISAEYEECLLKAAFLEQQPRSYSLLETMRLDKGSILYVEDHLLRLAESAAYFDTPLNRQVIEEQLHATAASLDPSAVYRIRLQLGQDGQSSITTEQMNQQEPYAGPDCSFKTLNLSGTVTLAGESLTSTSPWLFHKTTNRSLYDEHFKGAQERGHLDILFLNEKKHLCEGAISNIFVLIRGQLYTPPLRDGLLPGILRTHLIKKDRVQERHITLEDVKEGTLYIGNALRGLRKVALIQE